MKVLLIQPATAPVTIGGDDFFIFEPLALEYLGAGIRDHHEVKILDMRFNKKDLDKVIGDFEPHVVGITAYTVNVNTVKELFKKIKASNPEIFTVAGGHHATVAHQDFFTPHIDLVILGEGIFVFKEVIRRLEGKKDFEGISGIAYEKDGKQVVIPPEPVTDLDIFPFPDRKLTKEDRKHYFCEWMKPLASIRTSKGCPFRCNFCALWKVTGGRYLKRSPENIVKELSEIKEDFVFFSDDESMVDTARMKTLAGLIKEAGIKKRYFLYGRSDTIVKNPELFEIWKDAGLERVFVGFEFFRNEDMEYIKKGSTVEQNKEAIRILQANDIEIYASFIIRPEFTREDFIAFKDYCRELDLSFTTFAVLTPLPGTDFYEEVKDRFITRNYDMFDFIHTILPTKLPLKDFYNMYAFLFEKSKSLSRGISFMRKYPLREIPGLISITMKFSKLLRNAYKDY